jgi:FKBP-type peptidyl-prolyl cis-trans isomerase FklB
MVALAIISANLLVSLALAGEAVTLKDQKARESYSLGYQFGRNVTSPDVEIDKEVLVAAVRDALDGKRPILSLTEMSETVKELQRRVLLLQAQRTRERAARNLEEAKVFLNANGKKEGVVTLPSGLQYKVIREGTGAGPKMTDGVRMRFRGTLASGAEFDNTMHLADGDVPVIPVMGAHKGLTEALQLMKPGSKWQIFVPPDLGYGDRQAGSIPPNSVLIYELELLSVVDRPGAEGAAAAGTTGLEERGAAGKEK